MDDGACAYLTKPLDLAEFFRVVEEATSGSEDGHPERGATKSKDPAKLP